MASPVSYSKYLRKKQYQYCSNTVKELGKTKYFQPVLQCKDNPDVKKEKLHYKKENY